MRKLLVQGAHCILSQRSPDTDLKRWGLKLAGKGNKNAKKRALVAVARKLAILLHHLWVSGECTNRCGIANSKQWLKELVGGQPTPSSGDCAVAAERA